MVHFLAALQSISNLFCLSVIVLALIFFGIGCLSKWLSWYSSIEISWFICVTTRPQSSSNPWRCY